MLVVGRLILVVGGLGLTSGLGEDLDRGRKNVSEALSRVLRLTGGWKPKTWSIMYEYLNKI